MVCKTFIILLVLVPTLSYLVQKLYICLFTDPELPDLVMTDHIHSWTEQLLTGSTNIIKGGSIIPPGVRWINCQAEMCVIAKCDENKLNASFCSSSNDKSYNASTSSVFIIIFIF